MSAEAIKLDSHHLRGTLAGELATSDPRFSDDSTVVLKFHGIYQQDDRDVRRARTSQKLPLEYSCMVRAAVPGGRITPPQWLALDEVAELAGGTLRVTTRQGLQFHTVRKGDLRPLVAAINESMLTTLAACGDVVRNTMACPAPLPDGRQAVLTAGVDELVGRFRPRSASYWEVWVDGERAVTAAPPVTAGHSGDDEEPLYGATYLPRKFKIGFAWPGDNCIDVYSQDVGLVPLDGDVDGRWAVLAGGGLGMSYSRADTRPLLAEQLGTAVGLTEMAELVEAVITVQRDHGNREDRHRARLKYLVADRGIGWLRDQVSERVGHRVAGPEPLPTWHDADTHHGWFEGDDGTWWLGVPVPSGRVRDGSRAALRELAASGIVGGLRLTPRQDVLIGGVEADNRADVEAALLAHDVALAHDVSPVRRLAVACPALPTCGQALGEAERVLPQVVDTLEAVLDEHGLAGLDLRTNMTGCPNGCARPYTAELGIVGRGKRTYDVYLGGSASGTRLGEAVATDVRLDELPSVLSPVFAAYATRREPGERFGEFCDRIGVASFVSLLPERAGRR